MFQMYSAVQLQTPEASSYLAGSPLSESCLSQGATLIRLATDRSITARNCLHKALAHPGRALAADTHAYDATFRLLENTDAETLK